MPDYPAGHPNPDSDGTGTCIYVLYIIQYVPVPVSKYIFCVGRKSGEL
jgi:hypothetical protein